MIELKQFSNNKLSFPIIFVCIISYCTLWQFLNIYESHVNCKVMAPKDWGSRDYYGLLKKLGHGFYPILGSIKSSDSKLLLNWGAWRWIGPLYLYFAGLTDEIICWYPREVKMVSIHNLLLGMQKNCDNWGLGSSL